MEPALLTLAIVQIVRLNHRICTIRIDRDAEALRRVARKLPAGAVRWMSFLGRAPNSWPIGADDVHALPFSVPAGFDDWTWALRGATIVAHSRVDVVPVSVSAQRTRVLKCLPST